MSDREAARQAVLDYYDEHNRIGMDRDADPHDLETAAAGELLELYRAEFQRWRARGWVQTKPVKVRNLTVGEVTDDGDTPTVIATYCADSTGVDVVDRDGESQVVDGRPDEFNSLMWVEQQTDGRWLAVKERDGGDACDE